MADRGLMSDFGGPRKSSELSWTVLYLLPLAAHVNTRSFLTTNIQNFIMADRGLMSDFGGPRKSWRPPQKRSVSSAAQLQSVNRGGGSYNPRNSDRSLTSDFGEGSFTLSSPGRGEKKTIGSTASASKGHGSDDSLDFGEGSNASLTLSPTSGPRKTWKPQPKAPPKEPDVKARSYGGGGRNNNLRSSGARRAQSSVTSSSNRGLVMDASSFDRSQATGESEAHNHIIKESVAEKQRRLMQLFRGDRPDDDDIDAAVELDRQTAGTFQARMNQSVPFSFSPDDVAKVDAGMNNTTSLQSDEYSIREEEDEDEIFEQPTVDASQAADELRRLEEELEQNEKRRQEEAAAASAASSAWQERKRQEREEFEREKQRIEEKEARKMQKKQEEANRRALEKIQLETDLPSAPQLEEPGMDPSMAPKPADVSVVDRDRIMKKKKKKSSKDMRVKSSSAVDGKKPAEPVVRNAQYMKGVGQRSLSTRAILEYAKECEQVQVVEGSQIPHAKQTLKDVPLDQRENERAARLRKAMERIEKKKEEDYLKELEKLPELRMRERKDLAYQKYLNHGMPTKKDLARLIKLDKDGRVSEEDLDLLPWLDGDYVVDRAAMK
eukprot:CAMPEP_0168840218 /NCGR_PEP_ID=MMETSP0727-20121128/6557_1 /TAXON_ID=265536 /ORGANISM="Amphiprora sp., Strain CCMP467" /LENGTH=606 /DNA_ID=CAMNT_0008893721 /DNA_START=120 /DNA_END=1940 /DNA_ORIENTATION=+